MGRIKLVSSDLNGTLVHQHTMSDMIRLYRGESEFRLADSVFKKQISGTATMEEAFARAGPLTRGLTLRQAIEYAKDHIQFVDGFHNFIDYLADHNIPLVINSTGYSVTIYAIQAQIGYTKIHDHIGNVLKFGWDGETGETLGEHELEQRVKSYFSTRGGKQDTSYDQIRATGEIELGIINGDAKASLIVDYVKSNFPEIDPESIAHMGDTMGDSKGILDIAILGGVGIAFNYNAALEQFLKEKMRTEEIFGEIHLVDSKSESSDLMNVTRLIS